MVRLLWSVLLSTVLIVGWCSVLFAQTPFPPAPRFTFDAGLDGWLMQCDSEEWSPQGGVENSGYPTAFARNVAFGCLGKRAPARMGKEFPGTALVSYLDGVLYFASQHPGPLSVQFSSSSNRANSFSVALSPVETRADGWYQYAAPLDSATFPLGNYDPLSTTLSALSFLAITEGFNVGSSYRYRLAIDEVFFSRPVLGIEKKNVEKLLDKSSLSYVTNDIRKLAGPAPDVDSIAADGISRLLLRQKFDGPGSWELRVNNFQSRDASGALARPDQSFTNGATILQSVRQLPNSNDYYGTFIYRAPRDFVRSGQSGDLQQPSRMIEVRSRFTPLGSSTPTEETFQIEIVRPPVVFAHGLWSSKGAWSGGLGAIANNSDDRFVAYSWDYSGSAAASFATNAPGVGPAIQAALQKARANGTVATQVDWVGHSMGGVLPRVYFQGAQAGIGGGWRRKENFEEGDIRKLITLNSPHAGAPTADLLLDIVDAVPLAGDLLGAIGRPVGGAIRDLTVESFALQSMGVTEISSHLLAGTGGRAVVRQAGNVTRRIVSRVGGVWGKVLGVASWFASFSYNEFLFRGEDHDIVVAKDSQTAGLSGSPVTLRGGFNSIHTRVTSANTFYRDTVVDLLNEPLTSGSRFTPSLPRTRRSSFETPVSPPSFHPMSTLIAFTSPAPGTVVAPGSQVTVRVDPVSGYAPVGVDFFTSEEDALVLTVPFETTVTIPDDVVGDFNVLAFAADAADVRAVAQPLTLSVIPASQLQTMSVDEDEVTFTAPLLERAVVVRGEYADGSQRVISAASAGTSYVSRDPSVVSVSSEGLLRAEGPGVTTVLVSNTFAPPFSAASVRVVVGYPEVVGFGSGTAGTGGRTPYLVAVGGSPQQGNAQFALSAEAVVGGAPGVLIVCGEPEEHELFGVKLWCDPAAAELLPLSADGAPGAPGGGQASFPLPIPTNTQLSGARLVFQALFADSAGPQGLSATPGLLVTID
ncbi:alpha/beta fold hydrolase [bacterium]|nr:alpha/beta fold hydrolase [bacterium]